MTTPIYQMKSDELGGIGELIFQQLCLETGLTCNVPNRDRNGWDAIVEFPFHDEIKGSLDKREMPITVYVQIKTLLEKNKTFRLRLSVAERLVKEQKPTFICVLKIGQDQRPKEIYLHHIYDKTAEQILKKLRKASKDGKKKINRTYISLTLNSASKQIPPRGIDLKNALIEFCGEDPTAYSERKREAVKKLGYGERPFTLHSKFHVENISVLVDGFLGKAKLKAFGIKGIETRFDIALTEFESDEAEVLITPHPCDIGKIIIKNDKYNLFSAFDCEILFPGIPGLPREHFRWLVKTEFFNIEISETTISLTSNLMVIEKARFNLDAWINYFKLAMILATGEGQINIRPQKMAEVRHPYSAVYDCEKFSEVKRHYEFLEEIKYLISLSGTSDVEFNYGDIYDIRDELMYVGHIFRQKAAETRLHFVTASISVELPPTVGFIILGYFGLGDKHFGYCYLANLEPRTNGKDIEWISNDIQPDSINLLKNFPEDYQSFAESKKKNHAALGVYMRNVNVPPEGAHD